MNIQYCLCMIYCEVLYGSICQNTHLSRVSWNFITKFCSSSAHFWDFSTFKMADFLPLKKSKDLRSDSRVTIC